jgi:hypothetical protein
MQKHPRISIFSNIGMSIRVDRFYLLCELTFWIVRKKYLRSIRATFVLRLIWLSEVLFRRKWLECLKIHQKITFFHFFAKKINFFLITAQNFGFSRFMTHVQTKKDNLQSTILLGCLLKTWFEVGDLNGPVGSIADLKPKGPGFESRIS